MLMGLLLSVVIYALLYIAYVALGSTIATFMTGLGATFESWRPEPAMAMHWMKIVVAGVVAMIVVRDLLAVAYHRMKKK